LRPDTPLFLSLATDHRVGCSGSTDADRREGSAYNSTRATRPRSRRKGVTARVPGRRTRPMSPDVRPGPGTTEPVAGDGAVEEVEVRGHIVDSLLLPKILDRILQMGGTFEIRDCRIGARRVDPSYARIAVRAGSPAAIEAIVGDLVEHGATPVHPEDARAVPADIAGAFPDDFYSTTNQRTQVRLGG